MQSLGESLAFVLFSVVFAGILWIPATWTILTYLTPKKLLEKYFKEPHFTQTEIIFMSLFPAKLIRTSIFGWILLFPSLDRKRKIRDCRELMPLWYKVALNFLTIGTMTSLFLFLSIMGILLLMNWLDPSI